MILSNPRTRLFAILIAAAVYFGLALWSRATWVDPRPQGKIVLQIKGPYETFSGTHMSVYHRLDELKSLADSSADRQRSPILLYENKRLLGPPHSSHTDIAKFGQGRYSHWYDQGLVFSSSDNSDPDTNGRRYWVVVPN
jgi:hypothetical protein